MAEENSSVKSKEKKSWWKGLKAEFGKVIWPDKKTLVKQTIAVVVISVIICLLITLVDSLGIRLIQLIVNR